MFRYTRTFPRLLDGEGVLTCDRIQVQTSPAKDAVDITDLGALEAIDAPNAFGIEAKNGDLRLADTASVRERPLLAPWQHIELVLHGCIGASGRQSIRSVDHFPLLHCRQSSAPMVTV